ncbi:MAG: response regulator [Desulfobacteraceae bacterium]|jgi:PAS domain S-box-containing protein|nr:response regulator [Desulfobacteraceae bacterium]
MDSFSGLLNNSALMLTLCVIYDTFNVHAVSKKYVREGITGLIVGLIAIAVMLNPWIIQPGVFFDTRWVLLSLCGLFFGFTPTIIAVIIASSFRLYQGGPGGTVGTIVIVSTACTGLGWRYWQRKCANSLGWKQLYGFGFLVQLVMLSCMLLMPEEMRIPIIKAVAPPILLIYPILTMILGLILKRQEQRRATDKSLIKEVNERKTAELAARKSKEEWENTFNSITDIVSLQDTSFRILKINQAGCDALGLESKDIIGRHCYDFFSDQNEPYPLCPLAETANTLKPHAQEMFSKTLGKTFLVSAAPVLDENGTLTHLTHVARDITDKKKLEEDLFQAQKMESIGTLAGGIAHDFNNILSIIMGYAELAKDHIPQDSKAHTDIDQIFESSRRAADLVRQILTFSRKSNHSLEPLSPHLIVKEALKMLRASLPSTIHIQEEIDNNCGNIMADPTHIHQIVINLCTNALHSMENEKGTLSIRLYRETLNKQQIAPELGESPGLFVTLEITDTGHGMDPHVIANIFDPYFTTKEIGKGTGLGLSVIHGIIKDYHGFIRVDSKPGNGSRFQIYIPALTQEASAKKTSVDNEDALPTGTERILIVDDESSIVAVTQKILERLGYSVTITTESFLALEKIRSAPEKFDLVISDQTMPGLTGVDLSKEILKIRPDMPIIICTGYSSVISEENFLTIGIKKYLKKPISTKRLAMSIRQVIDES